MNALRNSPKLSLLIAFVALNLTIGGLVSWLKLPIYLDSLGIVLATILLGWQYGVAVALTTVTLGFFVVNPYLPFYTGTSMCIVIAVEFFRRRNMYRSLPMAIVTGLLIAIISAVVSAPVTALLFGGVTASGADFLTALFRRAGRSILESVILAGFSSEPIDKVLVAVIAYLSLRGLPQRFLDTFQLRSVRDLASPSR